MNLTSWMQEPAGGAPEVAAHKKDAPKWGLPWAEKYRPAKIEDIVGNESSIAAARKWAAGWANGKPAKKALIIYGRVGTGKTSLAVALGGELGWEILEMNASDKRNQELVEQIAGLGSQTRSLTGGRKMLLVEEIEGLSGVADRGAGAALAKVIKETEVPIILTCNDIENKKLSGIKVHCEKIELKGILPGSIVKALGQILEKEHVRIENISVLQKIADNCSGDMRSAINDLQAVAQGEEVISEGSIFLEQRDRPIDVYKAMQRIFRCQDYGKCRKIIWDLDEEPRNFITWLDENVPIEYESKSERAKALNQLSRADIFLGRVTNRQYWGFLRYVNDLMTVGIAFSREKPNYGFPKYKFPSLIYKMGSTRGKRAGEAALAARISPVVHESRKRIITDYLPLLHRVIEKNRDAGLRMVEAFKLEPEEIEHL